MARARRARRRPSGEVDAVDGDGASSSSTGRNSAAAIMLAATVRPTVGFSPAATAHENPSRAGRSEGQYTARRVGGEGAGGPRVAEGAVGGGAVRGASAAGAYWRTRSSETPSTRLARREDDKVERDRQVEGPHHCEPGSDPGESANSQHERHRRRHEGAFLDPNRGHRPPRRADEGGGRIIVQPREHRSEAGAAPRRRSDLERSLDVRGQRAVGGGKEPLELDARAEVER